MEFAMKTKENFQIVYFYSLSMILHTSKSSKYFAENSTYL